jgi:hypothetical protein
MPKLAKKEKWRLVRGTNLPARLRYTLYVLMLAQGDNGRLRNGRRSSMRHRLSLRRLWLFYLLGSFPRRSPRSQVIVSTHVLYVKNSTLAAGRQGATKKNETENTDRAATFKCNGN